MRKLFLLALASMVVRCTTQKPLTARDIARAARDTLQRQTIVVNNPTKTVEVPVYRRDTLYIEKETRTETVNLVLDTALLAQYLDKYQGTPQMIAERIALQSTVITLQDLAIRTKQIADSVMLVMENRLVINNKEEKEVKEFIATNKKIIYEAPKYIYFFLIALLILLFMTYLYLKRRLMIKQKRFKQQIKSTETARS